MILRSMLVIPSAQRKNVWENLLQEWKYAATWNIYIFCPQVKQ